jgi:hypothetical protein
MHFGAHLVRYAGITIYPAATVKIGAIQPALFGCHKVVLVWAGFYDDNVSALAVLHKQRFRGASFIYDLNLDSPLKAMPL